MTNIEPQENTSKNTKRTYHSDFLGGIIFILLGLILLLNNLNIIPWSIWQILFRFWPVLLIISGIQLVAGNNGFIKIAANIMGLLIVIYIFSYAFSEVNINFKTWAKAKLPMFEKFSKLIPQKKSGVYDDYGLYFNRRPKYSY
ncbi:MAG TPA: DUF5668 domain-containing protein [Patescibacteria group bacterium]|nr:DUF5668 domain-containing protein [Patescibacteria group bacterium]